MTAFGAVEAGGTKFVCAVGTGPEDLRARETFPTTTPDETLGRVVAFFQAQAAKDPIVALGVASFGPVDVHRGSPTYGFITSTPKPGWRNVNVKGTLERALRVPIAIDTDVNGSALGEHLWGAARGLRTFLYLTIGTGLGGGGMVEGELLHGLLHPEMGHMALPRLPADSFEGSCPFHGACWEGMASGRAVAVRWSADPRTLPADHPAWEVEAGYLALGIGNLICVASPQRIILGGGVMHVRGLIEKVRAHVLRVLNGYFQSEGILNHMDQYLVPPGLGDDSGVLGGIALAEKHWRGVNRVS
jgi:fructokinase